MAPPTRLRAMLRHLSPVTAPPAARASLRVSAAPQRGSAGKPAGVSAEQVQSYVNDGFVVVSGLIPEHILAAARDSIWEQMAAPPKPPEEDAWAPGGAKKRERPRVQRADRASWPGGKAAGWEGMVDGEAIAALFTPRWHQAAQALASAAADVSVCPLLLPSAAT